MSLPTEIAEMRKCFWQQCQGFQDKIECFEEGFVNRFNHLYGALTPYLRPSQSSARELHQRIKKIPEIAEKLLSELMTEDASRTTLFQGIFAKRMQPKMMALARRERTWEVEFFVQFFRRVTNILQATRFLRSSAEAWVADRSFSQARLPEEIYWIAGEIFRGRWKYESSSLKSDDQRIQLLPGKKVSIFYQYSFDRFVDRFEHLYQTFLPFLLPPRKGVEEFYKRIKKVSLFAQKVLGELILEKANRDAFFQEAFKKPMQKQMVEALCKDRIWEGQLFAQLMQRGTNILYAAEFLQSASEPFVNEFGSIYRAHIPSAVQQIGCEFLNGGRLKYESAPFANGAYGKLVRCWTPSKTIPICCKVFYNELRDPLGLLAETGSEEEIYCAQEGIVYKFLEHPNIPTYIARLRNLLFLEYIEGTTLDKVVLREKNEQYYQDAREIMRQIALALAYLHEKVSMLHGDLKPDNIIESGKDGKAKLLDFGLIRSIGSQTRLSVPMYSAPEVPKGEKQTPASDIWSLGVCLFFLLSGGKKIGMGFKDSMEMEKQMQAVGSKIRVGERLPPKMERREQAIHLIESMLEFDPRNRPQSMRAVLSAPYFQSDRMIPSATPFDFTVSSSTSSGSSATANAMRHS